MPGVRRGANTARFKIPEIVETYNFTGQNQGQTVTIPDGYKIKSIEIQSQRSYSGSGRGKAEYQVYDSSSSVTKSIMVVGQVGSQWGYNFGEGLTYGGITTRQPSQNTLVSYGSSSTTASQGAAWTKYTTTGVEYKVGKTYGTRIEEGTQTYSSFRETVVSGLFNGSSIYLHTGSGGASFTITFGKATFIITYEHI